MNDLLGGSGFSSRLMEALRAEAGLTYSVGSGFSLRRARGPFSLSINDESGILVEGFDTPPTLLNPHNPRYYVDLVERAGFAKAMDMFQ